MRREWRSGPDLGGRPDADARSVDGRADFGECWRADVVREGRPPTVRSALRLFATNRTFRPVLSLRLVQEARRRHGQVAALPFAMLHRWAARQAGVDLPSHVQVGPGLLLVHAWGTVVHADVRLGANVTLMHGVTLGGRSRFTHDGATVPLGVPVVGDGVWIGPHAVVTGPVHLGDGCRVAPNAVVLHDVEPACLVAGNPAEVLRRDVPPDITNPAPRRAPALVVSRVRSIAERHVDQAEEGRAAREPLDVLAHTAGDEG